MDSTDIYFNLDYVPQLANPEIGDYSLTSCSPCVDAGPAGSQEGDGSRFDLGPISYHQVPGELRGVISGTLNSDITYRMSCQVRVRQGEQLTIPAGTRIEATGAYNLEVFGRLDIAGTEGDSVTICPCQAGVDGRWGGLRFFNLDTISAPSIVRYANLEHYDQLDVVRPGVRFEHVRFDGGFFSGISVATGSADPAGAVVFQNCMITDCGSYGLGISASTASVHNTLIENVRGRGISMIGVGTGVEIFNSVVRTCSTSGIWMEDLCSPLIVNNVITDCSYHGLHLINNCLPTVMNTIVYANHRDGIRSELSSVPNLSYNNFAGNGLSNYNPASTACGDCISQDPLFVSNTDLHLGAGSPSIDAGNPDPSYNDANGSRNDQGAYGGPGGGVGILGPKGTVVMR